MEAPRNTLRIARRVRRRTRLAASVRRAGVGLVVGSALGLAAVVAQRAGLWRPDLRWGLAWWAVGCAPAAGGLLLGAASGLLRRQSLLAAAQAADQAMGLRDRLSNAMAFAEAPAGPAELLAIRDAERLAERVAPARVVPLRWGSSWAVWPAVLAAAVGTGLWAPQREARQSVPVGHEASEPEIRAAAEVLASAAETARQAGTLNDRAVQEELDRVAELERELLDGQRDPADALAEGARRLDSLADRVERQADAESLVDQATRERLADGLDPKDADSDLARALAEGDLQGARDAAAELMDRYERLTPEQRERYADELDRLAEQLREARGQDAPGERDGAKGEADASELERALRSQGIDDPAKLPETTDPAALREELERRGVEPDAAADLADRLARQNQERQAREEARQELERLEESVRDAADELREPPAPQAPDALPKPERHPTDTEQPEQPGGAQGDQDRGKTQPNAADRTGEERSGERQGEQRRDGQGQEQQGEQGQGQERQDPQRQGQSRDGQGRSGQETQDRQGQKQQGQTERQTEGQTEGNTGDQGEGRREEGQRQERQGGQERPGQGQEAGEGQGDERQGLEDRPDGQGQPRTGDGAGQGLDQGRQQGAGQPDRPGEQTGGEPEQGRPGAGEQREGPGRMTDAQGDAPDARGVERLRRQLDRMAERGGNAEQGQRSARDMREQAERMLEQATPEERRQLERMAREMARGAGDGPGAGPDRSDQRGDAGARPAPQREWGEEAFDARGADDGREPGEGRVVADWYGDEGPRPRSETGPAGSSPALREATRSAERALERRAVPRERQDLVRRVFERFRERAGENQRGSGGQDDGAGGGGSGAGDDS